MLKKLLKEEKRKNSILSKQFETLQVNHASLQAEFKGNNEKMEKEKEELFVELSDAREQFRLATIENEVIKSEKLDPERKGNGYRLIANTGLNGVQEVPHLHFHILGGKNMGCMVSRK